MTTASSVTDAVQRGIARLVAVGQDEDTVNEFVNRELEKLEPALDMRCDAQCTERDGLTLLVQNDDGPVTWAARFKVVVTLVPIPE